VSDGDASGLASALGEDPERARYGQVYVAVRSHSSAAGLVSYLSLNFPWMSVSRHPADGSLTGGTPQK
jgi:hypothetical protein